MLVGKESLGPVVGGDGVSITIGQHKSAVEVDGGQGRIVERTVGIGASDGVSDLERSLAQVTLEGHRCQLLTVIEGIDTHRGHIARKGNLGKRSSSECLLLNGCDTRGDINRSKLGIAEGRGLDGGQWSVKLDDEVAPCRFVVVIRDGGVEGVRVIFVVVELYRCGFTIGSGVPQLVHTGGGGLKLKRCHGLDVVAGDVDGIAGLLDEHLTTGAGRCDPYALAEGHGRQGKPEPVSRLLGLIQLYALAAVERDCRRTLVGHRHRGDAIVAGSDVSLAGNLLTTECGERDLLDCCAQTIELNDKVAACVAEVEVGVVAVLARGYHHIGIATERAEGIGLLGGEVHHEGVGTIHTLAMHLTAVGVHGIGCRGHDGSFGHDVVGLYPNKLGRNGLLLSLVLVLSPLCLGADVGDGIVLVPNDSLVVNYCITGLGGVIVTVSCGGVDHLGEVATRCAALVGLLDHVSLLAGTEQSDG